MNIKKEIFRNFINSSGLKTKSKLIIIESDDWGAVRMPSKEVYNTLKGTSIAVEKCPYSKFDTLEMNEDYDELFSVLSKYKDTYGNHPVITANFLTANPDFKKIKAENFNEYYFEDIITTYNSYEGSDKVLKKIHEGISQKMFKPQLHGREHMNPKAWLKELNANNDVRNAFNYNMFALSFNNVKTIKLPYLAAFYNTGNDNFDTVLTDAHTLFKQIFNESPKSFIAPVYIWDSEVERINANLGVNSIQGLYLKNEQGNKNKKNYRNRNKKTAFGQLNIVRNCFFEPSTRQSFDWVNECLRDISVAFLWNRPAVICTHRLNFMGRLDEKNRSTNLKMLNQLLSEILKKWPDVKFVNSSEVSNNL